LAKIAEYVIIALTPGSRTTLGLLRSLNAKRPSRERGVRLEVPKTSPASDRTPALGSIDGVFSALRRSLRWFGLDRLARRSIESAKFEKFRFLHSFLGEAPFFLLLGPPGIGNVRPLR
jgi:hypothetical protein